MAKNNAPTPAPAAEPTAPVEAAEAAPVAPSVEELQSTIARLEALLAKSIEQGGSLKGELAESASKLDDALVTVAAANARIVELEETASKTSAELAEARKANAELASRLADAREAVTRKHAELEALASKAEAAVARTTAVPSGAATFVAKVNLRVEAGWVRPGETFDASAAELEGYELGKHFDLKD
jgi:chromosome segregation ATPase